jgi:hypothetical protein
VHEIKFDGFRIIARKGVTLSLTPHIGHLIDMPDSIWPQVSNHCGMQRWS